MVNISFIKSGHCYHPEFVSKKGGAFAPIMFPATVAVIEHPQQGVLLFDTGYSEHFFAATQRFPEKVYRWITPVHLDEAEILRNQLQARGIGEGDVKHIFLSHFHGDHIGGARDYKSAKYLYHHSSYASLKNLGRFAAVKRGFLPLLLPEDFLSRSQPLLDKEMKCPTGIHGFDDGHDVFDDQSVVAVSLPGHEQGHMGLVVRANDQNIYLLVADACFHRDAYLHGQLPNPIVNIISNDSKAYKSTILRLHELHQQQPDVEIVPCHCKDTLSGILQPNGKNKCPVG
jgi:glyoxylase-like metal-dependent hydrolase (beta-lactamase superfamily II)